VVEDEPRLRELIERTLRAQGYEVAACADGADGYTEARAGTFDAIVLDVMLPTMSGLEISLRLRKQGIETPILMLTARDALEDRVAGLDSGADDYLVKPFAFEELLTRLRALLRGRATAGDAQLSALLTDLLDLARLPPTRTLTCSPWRWWMLWKKLRRNSHQLLNGSKSALRPSRSRSRRARTWPVCVRCCEQSSTMPSSTHQPAAE
jgi:DNA-binding response OmpR family regulator